MTQPAASWHELSERLEALALKLKMHVEQTRAGEQASGGEQVKDDVPEVMRKLRDALDDAFVAAGNATRDEAVRADVREAGRLFGDAFANTMAQAGHDVRALFENRPKPPDQPGPGGGG